VELFTLKALTGEEAILPAEAEDAWSGERAECAVPGVLCLGRVPPGLRSSAAQPLLLCAEPFGDSGHRGGCREQPGVSTKESGSSAWLGKDDFAVRAHQMLCVYPVHGRSRAPADDKGVLALEDCDADETLFELVEVSLVSFFFSSPPFFFPCGFLLSSKEQKSNFPCRSSLYRTRTLLNYFTYSPYSKKSSCSFLRSPDNTTFGYRQSEPLS